jgi:predicted transcriptional regulator
LKARLEATARQMNKGKNWILNRALEEYLVRHESLAAEARRQSLLAARHPWKDQRAWEDAVAETWNE